MTPDAARYVIVGAGVHGLSTAWHLARELRTRRRGRGGDIVVLDKTGPGAGASGIACGVIRNNYFQPAMRWLMAHSVSVWESEARAFSYHPVGYMQVSHAAMHAGMSEIYAQQREIGYPSAFIEGEAACRAYLRDLFPDWQARGITSVLHEKRGGYANNVASVRGLAAKAEAEGVRILPGVRVTGLDIDGGAVHAVETDHGAIRCEQLIIAAGPWVRDLWTMLDLPEAITVRGPDGELRHGQQMWTYWLVQEGTLKIDPASFTDASGKAPPVIHVDTDAPLYDDAGHLVTDQPWGIYYKPDPGFGGVQGGSMPRRITGGGPEGPGGGENTGGGHHGQGGGKNAAPADEVAVDPYGPGKSPYVVGDDFARLWTAGLAHCHSRFEGTGHLFSREPSGGIGCFTPDSFPVFDTFRQNAFVIADSNHGYKMVGVGALVAKELLGEPQELLAPFRFARYERGELHPTSSSPFPWS